MFRRHKFKIAILLACCGVASAAATRLFCNYLAYRRANDYRVLDRTVTDERFELTILSAPYRLDRVYLSMRGLAGNQPQLRLVEGAPGDETLYLTGIDSQVVNAESFEPESNEFFCHANLTLSPATTSPDEHNASFSVPTHADWRLFTLVPGRWSIHLPDGFGIPIKNATDVDFFTMSLNQNPGLPERSIRVKTTMTGRRGGAKLRPLFRRALSVYQRHVSDSSATVVIDQRPSRKHQGEQCAEECKTSRLGGSLCTFARPVSTGKRAHPGQSCCVENASKGGLLKQFGPDHTIHWMVPPGKHVYRTEVTEQLNLPFSTTAHYVTGHIHPYGKSIRLVDMGTGKTVFEITGRSRTDRLGVQSMSEIKSATGIPIRRDRRYELIAEYANTTRAPIDAMAIMYLYALDEPRIDAN